jgi:hypothetical protein
MKLALPINRRYRIVFDTEFLSERFEEENRYEQKKR